MMKRVRGIMGAVAAMAFAGAALAGGGGFVNGNFETGVLSPWVVTPTSNGMTLVQDVQVFDVTGNGASFAGRFSVGQQSFVSGQQDGVNVTQMLNLTAGSLYVISFDWAASATGGNSQGGVFSVVINGNLFGTQEAGFINGGEIIRGSISIEYVAGFTGAHDIGVRITRPFTAPAGLFQYIDNVSIVPAPGALALLGLAGLASSRRRRRA